MKKKNKAGPFGLTMQIDGNYLAGFSKETIIERLAVEPEDLIMFVDETGHEDLAPGHKMFGLCGCALFGRDYTNDLIGDWIKLKKAAFHVAPKEPFHAARHLRRMAPAERANVRKFLEQLPAKVFASFVTARTHTNRDPDFVRTTLNGIRSIVNLLVQEPAARDWWIFEHSHRTHKLIATSVGGPGGYARSQLHLGRYFMRKSSSEPGLEWADLIASLGYHIGSSNLSGASNDFYDLAAAVFDDSSRGKIEHTEAVLEMVSTGPSPQR